MYSIDLKDIFCIYPGHVFCRSKRHMMYISRPCMESKKYHVCIYPSYELHGSKRNDMYEFTDHI